MVKPVGTWQRGFHCWGGSLSEVPLCIYSGSKTKSISYYSGSYEVRSKTSPL